jgi:hypothetical protein
MQQMPNPLQTMNRFHGKVGKEGAEEPEPGDHGQDGALSGEASTAEDQALRHGKDCQEEKNNVGQTSADPERQPTPMRGDAPKSAVPEALREKQQRQNAQANNDPQQQKAPIHGDGAPKRKVQV